MVQDRYLRPVLQAAVDENDQIDYFPNVKIQSHQCTAECANVTTDAGQDYTGKLLIAADGRQAQPRRVRVSVAKGGIMGKAHWYAP